MLNHLVKSWKVSFRDGLALLVWIASAFLAFIFYAERTIFLDASFKFFEIAARGTLTIQSDRWGDILPQSLIWLSTILTNDLSVSLRCYSLSFITVGLTIYLLIRICLAKSKLALLIPLMTISISSHSFFWFTNEQFSAYPLMILAWAIFLSRTDWFYTITGIVFLILALLTHPLIIISHLFILIYLFLDRQRFRSRQLIMVALATFTFLVMQPLIINMDYNNQALSRLSIHNIITTLDGIDTVGVMQFVDHLSNDLITIPLLLVIVSLILINVKNYMKMCWVVLATLGYCFVNIVVNIAGGAWFHIETHYLPLSTILFFPILHEWDHISYAFKKFTKVILLSVVLFKLTHIIYVSSFYSDRLDYIRQLTNYAKVDNHILIDKNSVLLNQSYQHWASSYETMLLSSLEHESTKSVVIIRNAHREVWRTVEKEKIMAEFTNYKRAEIRTDLFKFQGDTIQYKMIK